MMSRSQVWCSVSEELRAPRPRPQPLPGPACTDSYRIYSAGPATHAHSNGQSRRSSSPRERLPAMHAAIDSDQPARFQSSTIRRCPLARHYFFLCTSQTSSCSSILPLHPTRAAEQSSAGDFDPHFKTDLHGNRI